MSRRGTLIFALGTLAGGLLAWGVGKLGGDAVKAMAAGDASGKSLVMGRVLRAGALAWRDQIGDGVNYLTEAAGGEPRRGGRSQGQEAKVIVIPPGGAS